MNSSDTPLESRMRQQMPSQLGPEKAKELEALYDEARIRLFRDVLPQIPGEEPSLTDHGPDHIRNVLSNAHRLIYEDVAGEEEKRQRLSGIELYALCLSILLHDAGNVFGRKGHVRRVAKIHDWLRLANPRPQEKAIVARVAGAHGGKTDSGDLDTIGELGDSVLDGHPVRCGEIAAILRFADELAEGPQRTSKFMQDHHRYDPESLPFHNYANITEVSIDRDHERVVLMYNIDANKGPLDSVKDLLHFTYHRILKLDQERAYARHYSRLMQRFRFTEASFNFWGESGIIPLDLAPIVLSEIVVPGQNSKTIPSRFPQYRVDRLLKSLTKHV